MGAYTGADVSVETRTSSYAKTHERPKGWPRRLPRFHPRANAEGWVHSNTVSITVGLTVSRHTNSGTNSTLWESTVSSYFPLRYDVHTYNHLNPVWIWGCANWQWAVVCLASGSCQFAQPYIQTGLKMYRCERQNVTTHSRLIVDS